MRLYIFYFFVLFGLLSCKNDSTSFNDISYPYKIHVLTINPLDNAQNVFESPSYLMTDVDFDSLTDLNHLDGLYFKLYRGGVIEQNNNDLIIKSRIDPRLNYKVIDGVVVAKDYNTLAMLSSYYQFDFLASNLKKISGIQIEDIVSKYGKLEIFFEPKFTQSTESFVYNEFPKENAAYLPYFHKFILFSRSKTEYIPLSMNLQVIAHEFGHTIWDFALNREESSVCDRLNAEYVLNGLNEGFADFFSYTFTGSTNILYNSLKVPLLAEMRNFSMTQFTYHHIINSSEILHKICEKNYYCIGTVFAKTLFQVQKKLGYNQKLFIGNKSRSEFLEKIVFALMHTRDGMVKYLPPTPQDFDSCSNSNFESDDYNNQVLVSFFSSFLRQIDDIKIRYELSNMVFENFGIKIKLI